MRHDAAWSRVLGFGSCTAPFPRHLRVHLTDPKHKVTYLRKPEVNVCSPKAKRDKAEAAAKGRGEKRAKDFMEREFADDILGKALEAAPEVRIPMP